jgi:hypothetical protein
MTGGKRFVMYPSLPQNPWVGTTQHAAVPAIRQVVEGPAGRPAGLTGPARRAHAADDVLEAYRARYVAGANAQVDVYAIRFKDPSLTAAASMNRLDGNQPPRIVRGDMAARLIRGGDWRKAGQPVEDCFTAIRDHIASLK